MSAPSSPGLRARSLLADDELEPYVRKRRCEENSRRKLNNLNEEDQQVLRTSINSRERRRMHDLNDALQELRSCLPYSSDANVRKMSKINTLLLASNWIRQLSAANRTLQAEVAVLRSKATVDEKSNTTPITIPTVQLPPIPVLPLLNGTTTLPLQCSKRFGQACFCIDCLTGTNSTVSS